MLALVWEVLPSTSGFGGVFGAEEAMPYWAQYGVLGIIIIALVVTKQLVAGWIYAEVKEENEQLKAENKELVKTIIDNQSVFVPALAKATETIDKAMAELQKRGTS